MNSINQTEKERGNNIDDVTGKGAEQWRTMENETMDGQHAEARIQT